ncbi:glycosyltransferase family 39 protein [Hippea maritima]|uniref:Glycosyl transferase family 39 n=1 Tax=Hippea maritima (strain ATCC 700847 / DSM 10411 / MH2) TaxID=760142 RepID=F2LXI8_HIPMA|nr:glycosyltransferase family 39 protein [Hippea maritima]AEA33174.1 glycosyl transferase family 39 [Hippea maritima DSM 10411]
MIESRFSKNERLFYVVAIALIASVFFFMRSWEPYLSGDSLKHAAVAKGLLFNNNWFNLNLVGEPYLKKPPLYFWLMALSYKIFGVSAFAARFFPALFAVFDGILVFYLSKMVFKRDRDAFVASMFFVINFHVIRLSSIVRMESIITFFVLLNLYLLIKGRYVSSGIPLGLGVLTKGPVGLIGVFVFVIWRLLKRDFSFLNLRFFAGLTLAFILSFPWYLYQFMENKAFYSEFVGNQILARIKGTLSEGDKRSYLFYFRRLLSRFWPGLPFFVAGLFFYFKKKLYKQEYWSLFGIYLLLVFVLINIPHEKFTRYLYYLYPIAAPFCAIGLKRLNLDKYVFEFSLVLAVLFLVGGFIHKKPFHHPFKEVFPYSVYENYCRKVRELGNVQIVNLQTLQKAYFYFYCIDKPEQKPKFALVYKDKTLAIKPID